MVAVVDDVVGQVEVLSLARDFLRLRVKRLIANDTTVSVPTKVALSNEVTRIESAGVGQFGRRFSFSSLPVPSWHPQAGPESSSP
jgi:hypothetical protein